MGYADERAAIEARFSTGWGVTTPIAWDNVDYIPTPATTFVSIHILAGKELAVSVGASIRTRNSGLININIFVPKNTGTNAALALADTAAAIFRHQSFSPSISCRGAEVKRIGQVNEWFQYNASISFQRDECITP
ncbi:MAG: hypothetical protein GY757_18850 [bacterium]|nr:hypothetical protein [bacterium]